MQSRYVYWYSKVYHSLKPINSLLISLLIKLKLVSKRSWITLLQTSQQEDAGGARHGEFEDEAEEVVDNDLGK